MEIYLVRHTTPLVDKGICYGQTDLEVASSFAIESKKIKEQLPIEIKDYKIYSSPLKRCKTLASYLSTNQYTIDHRLIEINFGDWEMKKWDEIPLEEIQPWYDDYVNIRTKNGESLLDVYHRTTAFLNDLKAQNQSKVILVTHAGVMRTLYGAIANVSLDHIFDLKLAYGEVQHYEV